MKDKQEGDINPDATLDRREFLKVFGGGITVFFTVGIPFTKAQQRGGRAYPADFNAYLKIAEDGRVSCFTGKIEMGQGIYTSLAQMLAEELEVSLESVDMVMGDTTLCPYDSSTTGSRSTKYFGPPLRRAAAEAKAVLLQLASEQLQVPKESLITQNGVISNAAQPTKRITYAQLARGKNIERHLEGEAPLKRHAEHTISGKAQLRTDALQKVTGEAKFTGDIRLPGMLYAKILRPPAHGAELADVDLNPAKEVEGTIIVEEEDIIAVLHESPEEAEKALNKISAQFRVPESEVNNETIFTHLRNSATRRQVVTERGDLENGKKSAAKLFETSYFNQYVAHAPIETHTALVHIDNDEVKVWASTQAPFRVKDSVARTVGVSPEKVRVFPIFIGGGFGGKKWNTQEVEAAKLAKITGRPVQVAWSRKEEFFYDAFRPAAVIEAKSGVDKIGKIVYWDFDILYAGTRSSEPIYDIPHYRVRSVGGFSGGSVHLFNTGAWRGPGSNTNVFAMESQTDIMAQAAGIDPLSFRLQNLADERMKHVLNKAADKFNRSFAVGPSGKGYGIACTNYLGTYVVTMAEVKVDEEKGTVDVVRVVCAQDLGEIINPQGVQLQLESCITMGLSAVLSEEVRFNGGKILDENFDTYTITRFSWMPKIETVLVENPDLAPQGCGEPAITTMGAVLANAIYDAVGVRMFELPITPKRLKAAIDNTSK